MNSLMVSCFSVAFNQSELLTWDNYCNLSPEEFVVAFYSTFNDILGLVAPFRYKYSKPVTDPWLNDTTCAFRHTCRRTERKWKGDHVQVSLDILKKFSEVAESC